MVWGCFVGDKLGPLVFIDDNIIQDTYIQLLQENLLPFIDLLHSNDVTLTFQQDNASPHTATKTRYWLEVMSKEHEFTTMIWPANSPDLNPIENLWATLKLELYRQYPDTMYLRGSPHTIHIIMKERLNKIWWEIGEKVLNDLIDSMSQRIEAVLNAQGWYTRY